MIESKTITNWPKISIITPSLNQGAFIEQTLLSIIEQGYPNLEYIIIDGGSQDNTKTILEKYKKYIDVLISEPDRGQTNAINKGLKLATGEIVGWLNSDDILIPGALFHIGAAFNDPRVMICSGNDIVIDEVGEPILYRRYRPITQTSLLCLGSFSQPTIYWRKNLVQQIGYLNETLRLAMDYEFLLRLTNGREIPHINQYLAGFRSHSGQKTALYSSQKEVITISKPYIQELFGGYLKFIITTYEYRVGEFYWLIRSAQWNRIKKAFLRFFYVRWRI